MNTGAAGCACVEGAVLYKVASVIALGDTAILVGAYSDGAMRLH